MTLHARVAVIGGGVVGCSVLYHLAKRGWDELVLLERSELTAGSTWHAAGGMHTFNGDPKVAALQKYTIELYRELEEIDGTACGVHRCGCLYLASTARELEFFRSERSKAKHLGLQLEFIGLEEARRLNPLLDTSHFIAAMFDPNDGHVDPSGVTHALAKGAKDRSATVLRHRPVTAVRQCASGEWQLDTPQGTVRAEFVVNAAGLWAREVGRMFAAELPILPMEHQFVITNDIPELQALGFEIPVGVDFNGASYFRQERQGLLLGTYEQDCRHWALQGTPQDFGMELLAPDLERISAELEAAMLRIPALAQAGIKRVINGGMVFSPDGNPIVGPLPGHPTAFVAAGCMAGFSQGGAVGRVVADWIVDGEPGMDASALDIARYGAFATPEYVRAKTAENYRRRFIIPCPNEGLEAARPAKTSTIHALLEERGALFGAIAGWEVPSWFAGVPEQAHETPTFRRSNAFAAVAAECEALRSTAGLLDTSSYCRIELTGPAVALWLDEIIATRMPQPGGVEPCLLLTPRGRILGDGLLMRMEAQRLLLMGSPSAESIYLRWLQSNAIAGVCIRALGDQCSGLSLRGPNALRVLSAALDRDLSDTLLPHGHLHTLQSTYGMTTIARAGSSGQPSFELLMPPQDQIGIYEAIHAAGAGLGVRDVGTRAVTSERVQSGSGAWGHELTQDFTPAEAGLSQIVQSDKPAFIGRSAYLGTSAPERHLSLLRIHTTDVDPAGNEPVLSAGRAIARLTSAAHSYAWDAGLGLAYLPVQHADTDVLEVEILGMACTASIVKAVL